MTVGGVGAGWSINDQIAVSNNRRVLGSKFNYALEDVNSGSKVNEPLMAFSNPETESASKFIVLMCMQKIILFMY